MQVAQPFEVLLVQSALLLGFADEVTWWLLRLRVYRDFQRFLAHGDAVLRNLDSRDVCQLVGLAGAVHNTLLQQAVPFGLVSPLLHAEPHRPTDFAAMWLASRVTLDYHLAVGKGIRAKTRVAALELRSQAAVPQPTGSAQETSNSPCVARCSGGLIWDWHGRFGPFVRAWRPSCGRSGLRVFRMAEPD